MPRSFLLAAGLAVLATGAGQAGEFGIDQLRAGVLAHSVDEPGPNGEALNFTRWEDLTFEALFTSPDIDAFRWIGSPKPNIGATVNLNGRESMAHLGLTWQAKLFDSPVFIEGTFGAAVNNGHSDGATYPERDLGCALMFYEGAGLGMAVTGKMDVMVSWEHSSSANLCAPNRGLTNVGVKLGYHF